MTNVHSALHLHVFALHAWIACACMPWVSRLSSCCRSTMRRSSPLKTLNVIMPQAGCCVAVGLKYRCTGVGTPMHLGLSVSWIACIACYNSIVQLGCILIAWWLCRPPW